MGILNTATKESIPKAASITVMTMTTVAISTYLSKVCIYAFMVAFASPDDEEQERSLLKESWSALLKTSYPFLSFCIGAIIGAALMHYLQFFSLLVPAGILLILVIDILAMRRLSELSYLLTNIEMQSK